MDSSLGLKLSLPLRILATPVYQLGAGIHRRLYDIGLKKRRSLPVPVICVGNLTVGGSGKTPVVIALAQLLTTAGYQVGVVSRGYKKTGGTAGPLIVSNGNEILADARQAGDEPLLIARQCPGVTVVVSSRRHAGGATAMEQCGCNLILLDDGFQHWALERDLDLVCVDAALPLRQARLLPWGPYRENPQALKRASAILLTQSVDSQHQNRQRKFLNDSRLVENRPVWSAVARSMAVVDFNTAEQGKNRILPSQLAGKKIIAVCAIARPHYFRATLENLNVTIAEFFALPDHDAYADLTLRTIESAAKLHHADMIITTAKDHVKLAGRVAVEMPWNYLVNEVVWSEEEQQMILKFIRGRINPAERQS